MQNGKDQTKAPALPSSAAPPVPSLAPPALPSLPPPPAPFLPPAGSQPNNNNSSSHSGGGGGGAPFPPPLPSLAPPALPPLPPVNSSLQAVPPGYFPNLASPTSLPLQTTNDTTTPTTPTSTTVEPPLPSPTSKKGSRLRRKDSSATTSSSSSSRSHRKRPERASTMSSVPLYTATPSHNTIAANVATNKDDLETVKPSSSIDNVATSVSTPMLSQIKNSDIDPKKRRSYLETWLTRRVAPSDLISRGVLSVDSLPGVISPSSPSSSSSPPALFSTSSSSSAIISPRGSSSSSSLREQKLNKDDSQQNINVSTSNTPSPASSSTSGSLPGLSTLTTDSTCSVHVDDASDWSSPKLVAPLWPQPRVDHSTGLILVHPSTLEEGWHYELGDPDAPPSPPLEIALRFLDREFFREFISTLPQNHWISDSESSGPIIVSATKPRHHVSHVLVRTQQDDHRFLVSPSKKLNALKCAMIVIPSLSQSRFTKIGTNDEIVNKLLQFDQDLMCPNYKFGVLLCTPGQTDENAMFGNIDGPAEWDRFLAFLGDRVRLKGWTKFRGGLDVKSDSTGTHSVYSTFFTYQVMYHVSTMLPWNPTDEQQLERKRHLGNDIVVIVFMVSPTDKFDPLKVASHFNHTYVVVAPAGPGQYQISIANKPGVPPCSPTLPYPAIITADAAGRRFLMAKLINAERMATVYTPTFREKTQRTRRMLLSSLVQDLGKFEKKPNTLRMIKARTMSASSSSGLFTPR